MLDLQDRLHQAFPRLLDIRRTNIRRADYSQPLAEEKDMDPFSLCCAFLGETMSDEEKQLLQDVINKVKEVNV